tara:strand:- start:473 stop:700 length:228 start_codon:yes stop_codon:yes gene_type:complete
MSRSKQAIFDRILSKLISRKLLAWLVTIVLTVIFALTDYSVTDQWATVFQSVTIVYIGTQGAVDLVRSLKAPPGD